MLTGPPGALRDGTDVTRTHPAARSARGARAGSAVSAQCVICNDCMDMRWWQKEGGRAVSHDL